MATKTHEHCAHMTDVAEILANALAQSRDPDDQVRMLERTRAQAANLNDLDTPAYDGAIALVRRAIALHRHVPVASDEVAA